MENERDFWIVTGYSDSGAMVWMEVIVPGRQGKRVALIFGGEEAIAKVTMGETEELAPGEKMAEIYRIRRVGKTVH
jgi:hypothetical protein